MEGDSNMDNKDLEIVDIALNIISNYCPSKYGMHEFTEYCGLDDEPMDCDTCWRRSMFGYEKKKREVLISRKEE